MTIYGKVSHMNKHKGRVFSSWNIPKDTHGHTLISFNNMIKERAILNSRIRPCKNGYREISECGEYETKIKVK